MYIYKVENKINGKIYIGQTTKDLSVEYYGSGPVIIKALKKYGKENFNKEILIECKSKEELNQQEIFWISFYDSTNRKKGYNISTGGNGGNLGHLVNKKLSNSAKDYVLAKDRNGISIRVKRNDERLRSGDLVGFAKGNIPYNKGVPMSEKQKNKMRKPKTEEHRKKMSIVRKGKYKKPIKCLENNKIYPSSIVAAQDLGLTVPNIIEVLKGRAKFTKGYSFEYLN